MVLGIIEIILKDLFSWQCQNLCWLSLANLTKTKLKTYADIIDWRVRSGFTSIGDHQFLNRKKKFLYQNYAEFFMLPLKSFLDLPPCSKDMETGTARLASKTLTGFAFFGKSRRPSTKLWVTSVERYFAKTLTWTWTQTAWPPARLTSRHSCLLPCPKYSNTCRKIRKMLAQIGMTFADFLRVLLEWINT